MPQSGMRTTAPGTMRAAETLIRTLGATAVQFCFPLAGSATGDGAQLGLSQPQLEEITVAPVVVRLWQGPAEFKEQFELVAAAATLDQLFELRAAGDMAGLLGQLAVIRWNGRMFRATKWSSELFAGDEYLYRLQVTE